MKLGILPKINPDDDSATVAKKINEAFTRIESLGNGGLDLVNMRGVEKKLSVQNGVPVLVSVQPGYVLWLNAAPITGTFVEPTHSYRKVSGGFEVTVTWTGTATSCEVHLFVGGK